MFKRLLAVLGIASAGALALQIPVQADLVIVGQSAGMVSVGGSITGGTSTRVLFDNAGAIGEDADFVFSVDTLTVTKIGATTFTGANVATGINTFGTAADAINAIEFNETAGQIMWEGAAADTAEARLTHTVNAGFDTLTTIPATGASQTVAVLENAQAFTGVKTFSGGLTMGAGIDFALGGNVSTNGGLSGNTVLTPDGPELYTGSNSNSWHVVERGDAAFDFANGQCGTSACTDPTLIIHSNAQDATNYRGYTFYGSAGKAIKTLTETTATSLVRIPVAASAGTGGVLSFTVFAADATDQQTLVGMLYFSAVNKAGTETCATPTVAGTALNSVSSGTLVCTYACDTSPSNAVDIQLNCTSSLTQTTLEAYYKVDLTGPGQPGPQ